MSLMRDLLGAFMPHFQSRRSSGSLATNNAELVHDVDGDASAVIYINGTGTANATYVVEASPDGTNFFPLVTYPYAPASAGGTLPQPGQPLFTEAINVAAVSRMLCAATGGMRKIRVRLTLYTSGTFDVTINTDDCPSISPYVRDQKAASLMVTATGAAGTAVIASLPLVTGLRHYIDTIKVDRSASALLTVGAAPVVVTTTNLPGTPALSFGQDAAAQGADKSQTLDFGGAGMAALLTGAATTVVCPVYTGVIWRVNVAYRLGL
jgi:hypothetical protein